MRLFGIDSTCQRSEVETHLSSSEDSCLSGYCLDQWDLCYPQCTCYTIERYIFFYNGYGIWYISSPSLPYWNGCIDSCGREGLDDNRLCIDKCISTRTECHLYVCIGDFFGCVGYCGDRMKCISRICDIRDMCLDRIVLAHLDRLLCYSKVRVLRLTYSDNAIVCNIVWESERYLSITLAIRTY